MHACWWDWSLILKGWLIAVAQGSNKRFKDKQAVESHNWSEYQQGLMRKEHSAMDYWTRWGEISLRNCCDLVKLCYLILLQLLLSTFSHSASRILLPVEISRNPLLRSLHLTYLNWPGKSTKMSAWHHKWYSVAQEHADAKCLCEGHAATRHHAVSQQSVITRPCYHERLSHDVSKRWSSGHASCSDWQWQRWFHNLLMTHADIIVILGFDNYILAIWDTVLPWERYVLLGHTRWFTKLGSSLVVSGAVWMADRFTSRALLMLSVARSNFATVSELPSLVLKVSAVFSTSWATALSEAEPCTSSLTCWIASASQHHSVCVIAIFGIQNNCISDGEKNS